MNVTNNNSHFLSNKYPYTSSLLQMPLNDKFSSEQFKAINRTDLYTNNNRDINNNKNAITYPH